MALERVKDNEYYIKNGDWTISRANNSLYPYALWLGNKSHGNFKSSDEAKTKYEELIKNSLHN